MFDVPLTNLASACNAFTGVSYSYGAFRASFTVSISLLAGTIVPHYAFDLIYSIILVDATGSESWSTSDNIYTSLDGAIPAQNRTKSLGGGGSRIAKENTYCGSTSR